ncbi:MAG TPA: bifunctional 2-polyprenyl-6-hydroxyphenol methylase/3-demethylubiquinol 3-O-methyltransferase UbiG [Burkholderiaceae bacterium]|nr:bifunctional 2-polyprenyl-6-hydroxyphenol methylase/3-demethylubiquinol 3-O-methyltransferase UbiG [Burkholderiaceae bacterium]
MTNQDSKAAHLNVDPAELEKFSAMAAHWWDPESEFKPLHAINPLRLKWIQQHTGPLADKHIVDVGCGGGILSESMAKAGGIVTGIDLAEKSLQVARLHGLESGVSVDYQAISAEALAEQKPASFDVVTCMEMLEHVPDPTAIIKACAQLVKPGGWVFFSTLNRNLKSFLLAIVAAEYILGLLSRGTHSYENFIKPSELIQVARDNGLQLAALAGIEYNPLIDHYKISRNTSVNYLVALRA